MQWVSLGGGIAFTDEGYPLDDFCDRLKAFAEDHGVQVYLEPGDASVTMAGYLVTQVQDVLEHDGSIAIINAAVETHMLDNLIYREDATIVLPKVCCRKAAPAAIRSRAIPAWPGTSGAPTTFRTSSRSAIS